MGVGRIFGTLTVNAHLILSHYSLMGIEMMTKLCYLGSVISVVMVQSLRILNVN